MLKKIFTTKLVFIPIVLVSLIIIGLIIYFSCKRLTELERVKITEEGNKIVYNIDEIIEKDKSDDSYVMFALEYLRMENDTNVFPIKDVLNTINDLFDVNYTEDKLNNIGITQYMVGRGVTFDTNSMSYKYQPSYTRVDINEMPIVKYEIKKIKKVNKSKFIIIYSKYYVDKPYNIYNYFNGKGDEYKNQISISSKYLKGEGSIKDVKDLITKDNINEIGSITGELKVTYKIIDGKLKVINMEQKNK